MRQSHDEFGMNLTHCLRKGGTPDPEVDSCTAHNHSMYKELAVIQQFMRWWSVRPASLVSSATVLG